MGPVATLDVKTPIGGSDVGVGVGVMLHSGKVSAVNQLEGQVPAVVESKETQTSDNPAVKKCLNCAQSVLKTKRCRKCKSGCYCSRGMQKSSC